MVKYFARGKSEDPDIPGEMKSFLRYIRTGKDDGTSGLVREIETDVKEARTHEKWRAAYMTQQMRDMENRKLGREEGLIEGKKAGIIEGKKAGIIEGKKAGIQETISMLVKVKAKEVPVEEAAKRLNISAEEIQNMLT